MNMTWIAGSLIGAALVVAEPRLLLRARTGDEAVLGGLPGAGSAEAQVPGALPQREYVYQTYGERKLKIVFHYPEGWSKNDRRPAFLVLRGGAHKPRDKDGTPFPLAAERAAKRMPVLNEGPGDSFLPDAEYFARRGMVAGRVEYRQRQSDGVLPDVSTKDAALAFRWVRQNARELGIDPSRIVGAGGSGGGHLVAAVASLRKVHGVEGARPDALILHYPLLDWTEASTKQFTDQLRFALNDDLNLARRLSPALHWSKGMPPTLLFIGEKEPVFEQNRAFAEKWRSAGVELVVGENGNHGFTRFSPWLEKATARSDEFLKKLGYLKDEPRVKLPSQEKPKKPIE